MTMRSPVDDSFNSYLQPQFHHRGRNVFSLLARREIAPRSKKNPRWYWGDTSKQEDELSFGYHNEVLRDARRGLLSWVEAESLRHLLATYCPLIPQPKSTIAVAFSSDGKMLASTHGDHTVKITDCQTGIRLKVLDGHQRTPWVVRFHPKHPEILASGSLDQQVRMWNALTSKCIGSYDFYRAIASISFHAEGEVLAIASGHKLYIWRYDRRGETSSPAVVLKTRRSLRAVNFHPHGGPFLLTAEVNDIASSESPMTRATSNRSFSYPSPVVYVANVHSSSVATELPLIPLPSSNFPSLAREESRADLQLGNQPIGSSDTELGAFALMQFHTDTNAVGLGDNLEMSHIGSSSHIAVDENLPIYPPLGIGGSVDESTSEVQLDSDLSSSRNQVSNPRDPTRWRFPFLQGWLMGQSRSLSQTGIPNIPLSEIPVCNEIYPSIRRDATPVSIPHVGNDLIQVDRIQSELVASLVAAADTELPCTVRLKMWSHDIRSPCDPLKSGCRLTIPYVVLCSEMGAHFSPCGRFLAACVACVPPQTEADPGFFMQYHQDVSRAGTSPTQHSISARQVMFELRIYSLEKSTFGSVLVSRPIRAAHCLTSIQFSPTSEHILLAYGRRHSSLLKSVVIDGETSVPVYTVLEIYRVSDMQLVSVLPSAEDEVNVASFHPSVGGGLAYGTQGGKLRFLKFEGSRGKNDTETSILLEQNIIED